MVRATVRTGTSKKANNFYDITVTMLGTKMDTKMVHATRLSNFNNSDTRNAANVGKDGTSKKHTNDDYHEDKDDGFETQAKNRECTCHLQKLPFSTQPIL